MLNRLMFLSLPLLVACLAREALAEGEPVSFHPIRFEALLPLEAKVGPTGPVIPANAAELKFRFEISNPVQGQNPTAVATWYAEDVGNVVPPNFKIDSTEMILDTNPFRGAFTLNKPKTGWPLGFYRLEIQVGGQLVHTLHFKIE